MHSGFANLRSALPMNLKAHYPGFKIWAGAPADIDRITDDLARVPRPNSAALSCSAPSPVVADAMYRAGLTRFVTYDVKLDPECVAYCKAIMAMPQMQEWIAAAKSEPEELEELDVEF